MPMASDLPRKKESDQTLESISKISSTNESNYLLVYVKSFWEINYSAHDEKNVVKRQIVRAVS